MTDLGTLPGDTQSEAMGINSSGQVVGFSFADTSTGFSDVHAFLYSNGTMTDLGTLPGGSYSKAMGISDSGQVVGYSDTPGGDYHAFLLNTGSDTTTSLTAPPDSAVFGQPVTLTAIVSANEPGSDTPSGAVSFEDGGETLGTGTLTNISGVMTATFTTSDLPVGDHAISAVYSGDDNFNPSTSEPFTVTVDQADTSTTVAASTEESVYGQSVTFTAAVNVLDPGSGTPTGSVAFVDGGTTLGEGTLSTGNGVSTATFTTNDLSVGIHNVTAVYEGDDNFAGSVSTDSSVGQSAEVTVSKADTSTTVAASTEESVYGQSVTFTAAVNVLDPGSGTPTGSVAFVDGGTTLGEGTLSTGNGVSTATFTTNDLSVGIHNVTAVYEGDDNFAGSVSTDSSVGQSAEVTVGKADTSTTVAASTEETVYGQSVTFTAAVNVLDPGSGTPTGSVAFVDGGTTLGEGTLVDDGGTMTATFATSGLAGGINDITADYPGNGDFSGSTSTPLTETVVTGLPTTADLVVSITGQKTTVGGHDVVYGINVTNYGPGAALDVVITDTLPAGTSFVSATSSNVAMLPVATTANADGTTTVAFKGSAMGVGAAATSAESIMIHATVASSVAAGTTLIDNVAVATPTVQAAYLGHAPVASASAMTQVNVDGASLVPSPFSQGMMDLVISDGPGRQNIVMVMPSGRGYTVLVNGRNLGSFLPTGRIVVYGQSNSFQWISPSIHLPAWLYGGNGRNYLFGGGGNDVIIGGPRTNFIAGGPGRNLLIGGGGGGNPNYILGTSGDNLEISGTTSYDTNQAALDAILQEWASGDSYSVRVQMITETGLSAGGSIVKLDTSTIQRVAAYEYLYGGAGENLYFASQSGSAGLATTSSIAGRPASMPRPYCRTKGQGGSRDTLPNSRFSCSWLAWFWLWAGFLRLQDATNTTFQMI